MATGGSGSDVGADDSESKLLCAICLEKYRRPKLLPCFHTFCQSCLQGMVGSSPSLACPSCRTFVVLPPGGVRDLQTNFYIEEDLNHPTSSHQRRLCDACTEDRDATHTCLQCRQKFCLPCRRSHDTFRGCHGHTVVSLTAEDDQGCGKGGLSTDKVDDRSQVEMCPKHPSQQLLLHCDQCQADICIQCKLTQHDGHPTQDLADTRAKVKTNLQDMLGNVTQQRQQINHLILALNDRRAKIEHQRQDTEQDLRGRADTLHQWVNQSLDEAATSVQTTARELDRCLQDQVEQLQNKDTALQAQQEYVMRVLKDGREADVVSLEARLNSSLLETADMELVEKELTKDVPKFRVKHSSSAVSQLQLREFVGDLEPVQSDSFPLQSGSVAGSTAPANDDSSASASVDAKQKQPPKQFVYSKNPKSSVVAMCPISQNRLWIMYRPTAGATVLMKLFDAEGQVVASVNNAQTCSGLVAVKDDTILSWAYKDANTQIITADGVLSDHKFAFSVGSLGSSAANDKQYLRVVLSCNLDQVKFSKTDIQKWSNLDTACSVLPGSNFPVHVSSKGEYVAFVYDDKVFVCTKSTKKLTEAFSSYVPAGTKSAPIDVRFCQVDGQEQLLVTVEGDNKVHVVDHIDGGMFVGYFDTGPLKMVSPTHLATNFDQYVWIGCNPGKVVMVEL